MDVQSHPPNTRRCPECGGPASECSGGISSTGAEYQYKCVTCRNRFDTPDIRRFEPDELADADAIAVALGKSHALTIFNQAASPVTAPELREAGVPEGSIHRLLSELCEVGLLYECGRTFRAPDHPPAAQYRRAVETVGFDATGDGVDVVTDE